MKPAKASCLLYVVTDRTWLGDRPLSEQVEETAKAGATFLQLREKDLPFEQFLAAAKAIKKIAARYHIPFVVNDNIEIALAAEADGVHVGQSDMAAAAVRELIGPDKVLGVSVETLKQAQKAESEGADYLGVGAVFPTQTKTDADSVSLGELKKICHSVNIPVVAIGGISAENILKLEGLGLAGVAVVSAVFASPDIAAATRTLKNLAWRLI